MSALGLHHFSLTAPATVLDDLVAFYGDLLGLVPGPRPDFGINGYWLYAGGQPILHLLEDDNRPEGRTGYFDHVALACDDLPGVVQRLEGAGIEYGRMEITDLGQTQLFLRDPAGTTVELNFATR